jgi:hypothetical protein
VHQKHLNQSRIDDILNTEDGDFEYCEMSLGGTGFDLSVRSDVRALAETQQEFQVPLTNALEMTKPLDKL